MGTPEPFRSLGFAAVDWMEHFLVHGPGDVQGQPIELDDEFAAFIVKAYELDALGERRVRRAFLSRSKGRSKSGLAAMIECFEALGPARFDHWAEEGEVSYWGYEYETGEPVGKQLGYVEILNVATEEGQAGNTYDAVYYMLNPDTCSPALLDEFGKIDVGLTRINLPDKRGFMEPVTSADTSKDGGKSTFIVADETHLWILPRLKRLHGIMTRNLLKRKLASGWMLETSTMYAEGEGSVAEGTHAYAKNRRDKTLLFDHRQASMKWDLEKRGERLKALREAYGPASDWMNLDAIADSWDDPQVSEGDFRRYWLNQPVPTVEPPKLVMPNWPACATTNEPSSPAALGLAVDQDRVWLSLGASSDDEVPHLGSVKRVRLDTHRAEVVADVARIQRETGCRVVLDRKGPASSLEDDLVDAGVDVTGAGLDDYIGACADLYDAVEAKQVEHGDYDELNDAVAAAEKRKVGDRWAWSRRSGDVSMLEAVTLAFRFRDAKDESSAYEERGMVTL
jgi:hypothetical protein